MKNPQMTIFKTVFLILFGLLLNNTMIAQTDSLDKKEMIEQVKNNANVSIPKQDGANDNPKNENNEEDSKNKHPIITETTIQIIAICFFVVMLLLIILFFKAKVNSNNPYFGFHSIKFIGLILIFPGICILALISKELISGATLAALFGTIAGYVLSRDREDDTDSSTLKEKHKQEKKKLLDEISKLKDQINKLEEANP